MVLILVWLLRFPSVLHLILHIRFFSITKQCKWKPRIIIRLWILGIQTCQEWETPRLRSFVPDLSTDFSKCLTLEESSLPQFCNCDNGWEFYLRKTFGHSWGTSCPLPHPFPGSIDFSHSSPELLRCSENPWNRKQSLSLGDSHGGHLLFIYLELGLLSRCENLRCPLNFSVIFLSGPQKFDMTFVLTYLFLWCL